MDDDDYSLQRALALSRGEVFTAEETAATQASQLEIINEVRRNNGQEELPAEEDAPASPSTLAAPPPQPSSPPPPPFQDPAFLSSLQVDPALLPPPPPVNPFMNAGMQALATLPEAVVPEAPLPEAPLPEALVAPEAPGAPEPQQPEDANEVPPVPPPAEPPTYYVHIPSSVNHANGGNPILSPTPPSEFSASLCITITLKTSGPITTKSFATATKPRTTLSRPIPSGYTMKVYLPKSYDLAALFTSVAFHFRVNHNTLQFKHAELLKPSMSYETACLMSTDILSIVSLTAATEVKEEGTFVKTSDASYFKHLARMGGGDVEIDAGGRVGGQTKIHTKIRAHSHVIFARCPWLAEKIRESRLQAVDHQTSSTSTSNPASAAQSSSSSTTATTTTSGGSPALVLDVDVTADIPSRATSPVMSAESLAQPAVAPHSTPAHRSTPPLIPPLPANPFPPAITKIALPSHPAESVKMLLEYLTTNRVPSLGRHGFTHKTAYQRHFAAVGEEEEEEEEEHELVRRHRDEYQVPSAARRRADVQKIPIYDRVPVRPVFGGEGGTATAEVVVATMKLAAEAGIRVLRDMCVATLFAAVEGSNVVEILTVVGELRERFGMRFDPLRQRCMEVLLEGNNFREVLVGDKFEKFMREQGGVDCVVEAMADVLPHPLKRKEREGALKGEIERIDKQERAERKKQRSRRLAGADGSSDGDKSDDDTDDDGVEGGAGSGVTVSVSGNPVMIID